MCLWECLCFPWLRPYASLKLDSRSPTCVFLAYSPLQSAYFCLDRITNRIFTSRHVVFHETVFPFAMSSSLHVQEQTESAEEVISSSPPVTLIPQQKSHHLETPPQPSPTTTQQQNQTTLETSQQPPTTSVPPTITATSKQTSATQKQPMSSSLAPPVAPASPVVPSVPLQTSNRTHKPVQNLNLHTQLSPY